MIFAVVMIAGLAVLSLIRVTTPKPDSAEAHYNLGVFYELHRKDLPRALAQYHKYLDLGGRDDRVERIVKLCVFIASEPDFTDQPEAANGASDLMEAVFGDAGKHARAAVSVPVLPRNATVEIDCVVQVRAA